MTITSVRIYYYPLAEEKRLKFAASLGGFSEWFQRRLKPIRHLLRGEEAKGVNIVNLMLYENPEHARSPNEWQRIDNSFEFNQVCDLFPLEASCPVENIQKLMLAYAELVSQAPWPQVRALFDALFSPLSDVDRITIRPYLQWPRGEMLSEAAARKLLRKSVV